MVAILIDKLHIASSEIVLVHSVVANDIETGSLGILRALEHSSRAIAIEQIGRLAHLGSYRGTIHRVVNIFLAFRQRDDFILVMTDATA